MVGWAEFCGLRVCVDPGVFVPRRRSEFLVSVAVGMVPAIFIRGRGETAPTVIADLCCGTGALGLAVASKLAGPGGLARAGPPAAGIPGYLSGRLRSECSCMPQNSIPPPSRARGETSSRRAASSTRETCSSALPGSLHGRIDVLICNAPYVPTSQIAFMPAEAREHEALLALDGGTDGLAILRRVAAGAPAWLAPGGVLLVETSERQAPVMATEMDGAGLAARIHDDDEYGATVVTGIR